MGKALIKTYYASARHLLPVAPPTRKARLRCIAPARSVRRHSGQHTRYRRLWPVAQVWRRSSSRVSRGPIRPPANPTCALLYAAEMARVSRNILGVAMRLTHWPTASSLTAGVSGGVSRGPRHSCCAGTASGNTCLSADKRGARQSAWPARKTNRATRYSRPASGSGIAGNAGRLEVCQQRRPARCDCAWLRVRHAPGLCVGANRPGNT